MDHIPTDPIPATVAVTTTTARKATTTTTTTTTTASYYTTSPYSAVAATPSVSVTTRSHGR